jgi:hypothetical protein
MSSSKMLAVIGGLAVIGAGVWYANDQGLLGGGMEAAITIDANDIGGVVMGPDGPEAGVWVIAETNDLPTYFVRSVVTDDEGRFVLPDLPEANYEVWSRGYGLLDSAKTMTAAGVHVTLEQAAAPDERTAAELYPALYWGSLLEIPDANEFPGTGDGGNGINPELSSQGEWLHLVKSTGCYSCHQFGNEATRTLLPELGEFDSSVDAWTRRIQSGQASASMVNPIATFGAARALAEYADWTDRIAAGELPFDAPERPQGIERNVVVTQWDWSEPTVYMHDEISTDRRNPTVNAYGKLYGSPELSTDRFPVLDPVTHETSFIEIPVADLNLPTTADDVMFQPSPYWGDEVIWDSHSVTHNPMMDHLARVWYTSRVHTNPNPDFCREGSDHPSALLAPVNGSGRDLSMYDPATGEWDLIPTCFQTHHLSFTEDGTHTLWFSSGGVNNPNPYIGWFNTTIFEETGDYEAAQGWTNFVFDTNGNGVRDPNPVGNNDPVDPTRDTIRNRGNYSVSVSPVDGSIWGAVVQFPSGFVRVVPGDNPPSTALAQFYQMPYYDDNAPIKGHSIRGADIDRNGVMWAGVQSGHIASFDIRKCTSPLNGPEAMGQHCPEGWDFWQFPGPQYKNIQDVPGSAETSYYTWVDQFNTSNLGDNTPIVIGNASDSLLALVDDEVISMRVPYPMGFFAKGLDGRIDDPEIGWKGRGLWVTSGQRTPFHMETGKGTPPKVYHFQVRQNPLEH